MRPVPRDREDLFAKRYSLRKRIKVANVKWALPSLWARCQICLKYRQPRMPILPPATLYRRNQRVYSSSSYSLFQHARTFSTRIHRNLSTKNGGICIYIFQYTIKTANGLRRGDYRFSFDWLTHTRSLIALSVASIAMQKNAV